jgi:hypothetical protein
VAAGFDRLWTAAWNRHSERAAALPPRWKRRKPRLNLHSASSHEIGELRLGKKTDELYARAEKLHKQLDRHAYGLPAIRFTDADVDQARAAGVLIESDRGRPIIVDRTLYRELVKGAIKRTHDAGREGHGAREGEELRPRQQDPGGPGDGRQARA